MAKDNHHVHMILPKKLWEALGKLADRRTKKGVRTSRTALIIEGGELIVTIEKGLIAAVAAEKKESE